MFCAQCGQLVAEGMKFCPHCGAPVVPVVRNVAKPTSESEVTADPAPQPEPLMGDAGATATGVFARVKAILLMPSATWPVIAAEPSAAGAIYGRYVAPLAAIGVVAALIGHTVIGYNVPLLGHMRIGIVAGLGEAILGYLLSFVSVFVIAWLVDVLAPTFDGQRDPLRALKLTAYSYTPAWVAGVLQLVPALGVLALLAGCYGLYLLYLGLPVLMRCPQEKSLGYTIVLILCAIVVSVAIGVLSTCAVTGLGLAGIGAMSPLGTADSGVTTDAGGVIAGIFGGKSDADKARVSEALSQLQKIGEDAQKANHRGAPDPKAAADMTAALNAVGAIVSGGKDVEPVDFRKLREMLPETLAGMKRVDATGQSGEAMGIKGSSATARYTDGSGASLNVDISDMGSLAGLAGLASRFDPSMEKETETGYERTSKVNGQIVHERYDRRAKNGEISIILAERFNVAVRGNGVDAATLQGAIKQIDMAGLVALAK
ncbi:MAG TPA: YIP1 family protein [Casimicrobiaceae bacterium]|nr:YIP1 family protein [Casimicrobiaceae bacterium]